MRPGTNLVSCTAMLRKVTIEEQRIVLIGSCGLINPVYRPMRLRILAVCTKDDVQGRGAIMLSVGATGALANVADRPVRSRSGNQAVRELWS